MSALASDLVMAISPIVAAFEKLGIAYYIGGSVASSVHGLARTTLDVDVVAQIRPALVEAFTVALQGDYYVSSESILDAIQHSSTFNLIHLATMVKVDIFIAPANAYTRSVFQRRKRKSLPIASRLTLPRRKM